MSETRVCYGSMKFSNFNYPRVLIIHTVTLTTHVARVTTTMNKVHVVKVQQNILYHPETCFPPKNSLRDASPHKYCSYLE